MKYLKKEYFWKTVLLAHVKASKGFVEFLEAMGFSGSPKLAQTFEEQVMLSVWRPDDLVPEAPVDIKFEVRNDGVKRIVFHPNENFGIPMTLRTVVSQALTWIGACDAAKKEIMEKVLEDEEVKE